LNTEDNHKWNVAKGSFICTIIMLVSFFLAILFHFIFFRTNNKIFFVPISFCLVIGFFSYLISVILSIVVSVILIDIYKSKEDKKTEVILSAIHLALSTIGFIGYISIKYKT